MLGMTVGELMDRIDAVELEEWKAEFKLRDHDAKQHELNRRALEGKRKRLRR